MVTQDIASPYFELLGIPESELPANRYRLLGIPMFTSNENVIRNAAARQMQFLRRVGGDKYLDDVQQILNEVAEARLLLLNPDERESYDAILRRDSNISESAEQRLSQSPSLFNVRLTYLSGHKTGEVMVFEKDKIVIGDEESKADVRIKNLLSDFVIHRKQEQWIIEAPLMTFALNSTLAEDRAFLSNGDVIRFGLSGPLLQVLIGHSGDEAMQDLLEKYPSCRLEDVDGQAVYVGDSEDQSNALVPNVKLAANPKPQTHNKTNNTKKTGYTKKTKADFDYVFWGFCAAVFLAVVGSIIAIAVKYGGG